MGTECAALVTINPALRLCAGGARPPPWLLGKYRVMPKGLFKVKGGRRRRLSKFNRKVRRYMRRHPGVSLPHASAVVARRHR